MSVPEKIMEDPPGKILQNAALRHIQDKNVILDSQNSFNKGQIRTQ